MYERMVCLTDLQSAHQRQTQGNMAVKASGAVVARSLVRHLDAVSSETLTTAKIVFGKPLSFKPLL